MCAVALKRTVKRGSIGTIQGARRAPYPGFVEPCDPTLRGGPPSGSEWLHEIKMDGYRAQLHVHRGVIRVFSRRGHDWTDQFIRIADAAQTLSDRELIVDGEATVLSTKGVPDFQALRRELGKKHTNRVIYLAFDLIYLDGYDLRGAPLIGRKRALRELLASVPHTFVYSEFLEDQDAARVYGRACEMGLEGIVSKRRDSPYRSGRQNSWTKCKCAKSDNFPIVAFVEKLGARPRRVASLYLGRREGSRLLYAGKARSGYTDALARELRETLDPLIIKSSPLTVPVSKPKATWVRPVVEAEIEYGGITDDGLLRAAVFKGVRDDLALPALHSPSIVPRRTDGAHNGRGGVPWQNILQLLPDAVAPPKQALARYWRKVAKRALPFLGRRPLKLVRHARGTIFYHKGPLPPRPPQVHELHIEKREGGKGVRVWVDSLSGLLGLIEMDVVEVHPWAATVDDIEHPDRLVFDLDPGAGIEWDFVVETALTLRDMLQAEGLSPWPKLSGGKGLHLMVPVEPRMSHDAARLYCRDLARSLAATNPARYTTSPAPAQRERRIYIDYLRNGRGTTAVGTYSPRVRKGFPIAAPVTWTQLQRGIRADAFTMTHPFQPRTD
jgi:bifunctional non-homologous end joining protein LigD